MRITSPNRYAPPGASLPEPIRRAIIAEVALTNDKSGTARKFGVHPQTVYKLVRSVKTVVDTREWRSRMPDLNDLCLKAVERSLKDTKQIHKAAATAQTHWKGTGVYAPDQQGVTVNQLIATLPAKLKAEFDAEEADGADAESRE